MQAVTFAVKLINIYVYVPYISGAQQKRPGDFTKALKNDSFKREFVHFLVSAWEKDSCASIISDKMVYVTDEERCFSFTSANGKVFKREETDMRCSHEEADTRMIAHLGTVRGPRTVTIRTSDSDVLAIALGRQIL